MIRLHTVDIGPDDAPTIAWCHGVFGQGKNFTSVARALAPGYRSVLIDLPNHGHSEWTDDVDYDEWADIVATTLWRRYPDALPLTLLGHSMGAKVAMRLALRHPQLVQRLVVVDMSPVNRGHLAQFDAYFDGLSSVPLDALRTRHAAEQAMDTYVSSQTIRDFLLQNLRHSGNVWRWQMNLELLSGERDQIGAWPPIDGVYEGPVLWLLGGQSGYAQPGDESIMKGYFPRVLRVVIKEAGHWVHADQPEAFVDTVRRFIEATS